ncbi:transmembrane protein, putative (macronuclear) [Tetrahymena thermophila SB210]|uniref:Transmembrane protein, putative n=1 Tax=Tetrahymena thermophila (strain SB210) TaxID=312017 RepID=Q23CY1_TETTS|nr:transmembrane protein, putative [Tetrahymena thermophila SB210]EAR94472.2 transmembrane protein, putative [Tetrahymena thermophila SB210]|eukprot:XP_001014905.2 transmembrane protein, putative [Tetrahymena thermophila SB210]
MSSLIHKTIKQFDIFSKPFTFFVGNKKSKSTIVGGFLSLSVIAVAVIYFYYLMNLYFTNQVEPKITQSFQIQSSLSTIHIQDSFFIIEMLINGQPLKQYEKQVNQVYLNYTVLYEIYYPNGTYITKVLQLSECTDSQFIGYQCIDQSAFEQSIDIFNNPIEQFSSDISIQINFCDPKITSNCASPNDISNLIFQQQNYFQVFTKIKQYSQKLKNYQSSYKTEYFYFDPNLITYTRLDLILATTTITEGLLLQKSSSDVNIYDYQRIDTFFSQINIQQRMGISGLGYLVYELNQMHNSIEIQNAMITEILAQFMSILNTMLLVGFLARYLAESYIVEDINNILLQEYYKKTALKLVQKKEIRNAFEKFGNGDAAAQSQFPSSYNILNRLYYTKDLSAEKQQSKILCEIQKRINETNFSEQQKQYFEMSFWERFKNFFQKILGFNQKLEIHKDPNSDPILYDNLLKQSMKRINIFEVYKDLIKLKMAIKLILTKDQYAAIQYCGSELCPVQTQIQQQLKEIQSQRLINQIKSNDNKEMPAALAVNKLPNSNDINPQVQQQKAKISNIFLKQNILPIIQDRDISQQQQNQVTQKACQGIYKNQIIEIFPQTFQEQIKQSQVNDDQYQFKSSMISEIQQSIDVYKEEQQNIFETNDNLIRKQRDQTTPTSILSSNQHHKIIIDKKDKIQCLRINGDQNELNQSDLSIEIPIQAQEDIDDLHLENKNLQTFLGLGCHLIEMDKIEENEEERENYLKQFFVKMNSSNDNQKNYIDQQIYQSLIINEKQVKAINDYFDQQVVINRRISLHRKAQITNLIEELSNKNKQSNNLKMQ